jgi:hypothetical protein
MSGSKNLEFDMKTKANEKIRKIDTICGRSLRITTVAAILLGLSFVGVYEILILHSIQNILLWLLCMTGFAGLLSGGIAWYLFGWYIPRKWKTLFLKEFPELDPDGLEYAVSVLRERAGKKYSFSQVAKSLVLSLEKKFNPEKDGDENYIPGLYAEYFYTH